MEQRSRVTPSIIVYGKVGCVDTQAVLDVLHSHRLSYTWLDLNGDPAIRREAMSVNGGLDRAPTVSTPDAVLVEPSADELVRGLATAGLITPWQGHASTISP